MRAPLVGGAHSGDGRIVVGHDNERDPNPNRGSHFVPAVSYANTHTSYWIIEHVSRYYYYYYYYRTIHLIKQQDVLYTLHLENARRNKNKILHALCFDK